MFGTNGIWYLREDKCLIFFIPRKYGGKEEEIEILNFRLSVFGTEEDRNYTVNHTDARLSLGEYSMFWKTEKNENWNTI